MVLCNCPPPCVVCTVHNFPVPVLVHVPCIVTEPLKGVGGGVCSPHQVVISLHRRLSVKQQLSAVVHFLVQNWKSTYFSTLQFQRAPQQKKENCQRVHISKIADLDRVFKVGSAKYPPPRKFKNSRFGQIRQIWPRPELPVETISVPLSGTI